jgi:hypothetical protein
MTIIKTVLEHCCVLIQSVSRSLFVENHFNIIRRSNTTRRLLSHLANILYVYLLSHIVLHVSSVSSFTPRMPGELSNYTFPLVCPLVCNMSLETQCGGPLGFLKVRQRISLSTDQISTIQEEPLTQVDKASLMFVCAHRGR